jgi:hypothetical protein
VQGPAGSDSIGDIREARHLFPATEKAAYFNTAAVGLASRALAAAYRRCVDDWTENGLDYVSAEAAAERASACKLASTNQLWPGLSTPVRWWVG